MQVLDIASTLLDYAGNFTFPKAANLPGESFADLLLHPSNQNTIHGRPGLSTESIVQPDTSASVLQLNMFLDYITGNEMPESNYHQELYDLMHDGNETVNLVFSGNLMKSTAKK